MTFDENQRRRRALGQVGTAALLERLEAESPYLRAYAERLIAAPGPAPTTDPVTAAAELRDAIGALRLLNAKRELGHLAAVLRDDPGSPNAARWRDRLVEVSRYVREVERSGVVRPRPWAQILAKEDGPCRICGGAGELRGPGPKGSAVRCWVCRP